MNHLCIDCRMWGRQYAGIGRYTQEIVTYLLLCKQWHFTLLTNEISFKELSELVNRYHLNRVELRKCSFGLFSIRAQFELASIIPKCDVLWVPSINVPMFPTRAKKLVTTIHDVFHLAHPECYSVIKLVILKSLITRAVNKSCLILTVSDFSAKEIVRFYGKNVESKIHRVYNGFNGAEYVKKSFFKDKFDYILFVGSVKPHKNLKNALLAFDRVRCKLGNFYFVIVGKKEGFITGDDDVQTIVDRINQNEEKVIFTGNVDDDSLYSIYEDAFAFIMPSYYEGFGIPLVEAMHFKLPIICSDIPVFHEVCGNQVLYFDPSNVDAISESILKVCNLKKKEYKTWPKWPEIGEVVGQIIENQF